MKARFDWLKKRKLPFEGEESARLRAPKLSYAMRETCRNHHWGLLFACAPELVEVVVFLKISRIRTELRAREDLIFRKRCLKLKELAKGTAKEPECPQEQSLLYEDDKGDVQMEEHSFGTLRVKLTFRSTGKNSGRASTYKANLNMDAMLYRTGNA